MQLTRARVIVIGLIITTAVAAATVILRSERSSDLVLRIEPIGDESTISVYVGGAVAAPGLYKLPRGARLAEALDVAGLSPEAQVTTLPMADELRDGQSIFVPARAATAPPQAVEEAPAAGAPALVNLNTASEAELEALPGIGPSLAGRIVSYRASNGPFASLEDLAAVRGISPRMVEDLRPLVTVSD